jgi:nicotinamide-nucleotide amidase
MKIEILCTGDEILTGKTVNTNHSYIAQRLTEAGLQVFYGTIVGDDRDSLSRAFALASERADAVIVNGGLGPTVDDLSQELAASAAGTELELHEPWLEKLKAFYSSRGRVMPENNIKQAMLPAGCEFIDNPIGTACGFAINIGKARFYFTPGVPREMRRMINEQVIPRILKQSGLQVVTRLKRFHSFGIGESRADELLAGIEDLIPGTVKLGFQSHYPQLETKLAAVAGSETELNQALEPAIEMIRERFASFILCEDDQTLEGVIINLLKGSGATLATMETASAGNICNRLITADPNAEVMQSGIVSCTLSQLADNVNMANTNLVADSETAGNLARHLREHRATDYALVSLTDRKPVDDDTRAETAITIAIATKTEVITRQARLLGGSHWVTLGSTEMALDALRRLLQGIRVDEKTDFEQQ